MTILADILNPEIPGKGGMVRKTHTQTHANMGVHPSPSPCLQLNVYMYNNMPWAAVRRRPYAVQSVGGCALAQSGFQRRKYILTCLWISILVCSFQGPTQYEDSETRC